MEPQEGARRSLRASRVPAVCGGQGGSCRPRAPAAGEEERGHACDAVTLGRHRSHSRGREPASPTVRSPPCSGLCPTRLVPVPRGPPGPPRLPLETRGRDLSHGRVLPGGSYPTHPVRPPLPAPRRSCTPGVPTCGWAGSYSRTPNHLHFGEEGAGEAARQGLIFKRLDF